DNDSVLANRQRIPVPIPCEDPTNPGDGEALRHQSGRHAFIVSRVDDRQGRALRPGDSEYDSSRALWNGAIDRKPAIVARCSIAEEVAEAVRFARASGLEIAVRGGGHNYAGNAACDGGMMIHLGDMNRVAVDPEARRVTCGGGATWGVGGGAAQGQ